MKTELKFAVELNEDIQARQITWHPRKVPAKTIAKYRRWVDPIGAIITDRTVLSEMLTVRRTIFHSLLVAKTVAWRIKLAAKARSSDALSLRVKEREKARTEGQWADQKNTAWTAESSGGGGALRRPLQRAAVH